MTCSEGSSFRETTHVGWSVKAKPPVGSRINYRALSVFGAVSGLFQEFPASLEAHRLKKAARTEGQRTVMGKSLISTL